MSDPYGKPTAKKVSGCEWYLPAVTTATGPKALPHGKRQERRSQAVAAAREILRSVSEATTNMEGE